VKNTLQRLYILVQAFKEERGQDLVEYALIVALIALAATAGMSTLAADINNAFSSIGTTLTQYAG